MYVTSENKGVEPILSHKNLENNRPQTGKEQIIYISLSDKDQNVILSTVTIQIAKKCYIISTDLPRYEFQILPSLQNYAICHL